MLLCISIETTFHSLTCHFLNKEQENNKIYLLISLVKPRQVKIMLLAETSVKDPQIYYDLRKIHTAMQDLLKTSMVQDNFDRASVNTRAAHLNDDMHIKFLCVESNPFIEGSSLAIVEIHCHIYLQHKFDFARI